MSALCASCATNARLDKDSYCRECRNRYNREWHQRNPQKKSQYRQRLQERAAAGQYAPRNWEPGKPGRPPKDAG